MSQSNIIAGFMTLAFVVYITIKGELPVYLGFLLAEPVGGSSNTTASAANTGAVVAQKTAAMNDTNIKNVSNLAVTVSKLAMFG